MNLSDKDLEQLASKGIPAWIIQNQLDNFKNGFPYANLAGAAKVGNGIVRFSDAEIENLAEYFDQCSDKYTMAKFVPASGAASRMFKALIEFVEKYDTLEHLDQYPAVQECVQQQDHFAFFPTLLKLLERDHMQIGRLQYDKQFKLVTEYVLHKKGLNYQYLPKALLLFHNYPDGPKTALEEHLIEAVAYAKQVDNTVHLHFTISPEHRTLFEEKLAEVVPNLEEKLNVKFCIDLSEQMGKTDMIALDKNGQIVRNPDGSILFRPGGHGALLENLNTIDADIIFIKNIDNIAIESQRQTTTLYKKALGGYLMGLQTRVFHSIQELTSLSISDTTLSQIEGFVSKELNVRLPLTYFAQSIRQRIEFLVQKLNRPIRVCGMVRNEGEPGGGPYWVLNSKNEKSLQIIESSQIDFTNKYQVDMVNKATHFNPVDLVCGVRNWKGNKFDLRYYVDKKTGFISQKTQNGIDMTIQELPGLWNGSMSNWNTVFVEVPVSTFTPVKTVNDLLRKEHQPLAE